MLLCSTLLQYKFAVIVMGKLEYISDDDQDLKVNISQFLPHSLSGMYCTDITQCIFSLMYLHVLLKKNI